VWSPHHQPSGGRRTSGAAMIGLCVGTSFLPYVPPAQLAAGGGAAPGLPDCRHLGRKPPPERGVRPSPNNEPRTAITYSNVGTITVWGRAPHAVAPKKSRRAGASPVRWWVQRHATLRRPRVRACNHLPGGVLWRCGLGRWSAVGGVFQLHRAAWMCYRDGLEDGWGEGRSRRSHGSAVCVGFLRQEAPFGSYRWPRTGRCGRFGIFV
jgi:hypothetical protein